MPQSQPTDAEKAMRANAQSRVTQADDDDAAKHRPSGKSRKTANPPRSTDLTGPGGDPAEGKR